MKEILILLFEDLIGLFLVLLSIIIMRLTNLTPITILSTHSLLRDRICAFVHLNLFLSGLGVLISAVLSNFLAEVPVSASPLNRFIKITLVGW